MGGGGKRGNHFLQNHGVFSWCAKNHGDNCFEKIVGWQNPGQIKNMCLFKKHLQKKHRKKNQICSLPVRGVRFSSCATDFWRKTGSARHLINYKGVVKSSQLNQKGNIINWHVYHAPQFQMNISNKNQVLLYTTEYFLSDIKGYEIWWKIR